MENIQYDARDQNTRPRPTLLDGPFDSLESAQEYISLLREALNDEKRAIHENIDAIALVPGDKTPRRLQGLQLVSYKMEQLGDHLTACSGILNNLRTLRRLLLFASDDVRE